MAYRICVSLWVILCLLCIGKGQEVYSPRQNDTCTNECSETDSRYWCGGVKEDSTGRVMRCVQYTRYGQTCVAECGGKKTYNWCLTNAYTLDDEEWWDYCSPTGLVKPVQLTVRGAPCISECRQEGQNYH